MPKAKDWYTSYSTRDGHALTLTDGKAIDGGPGHDLATLPIRNRQQALELMLALADVVRDFEHRRWVKARRREDA